MLSTKLNSALNSTFMKSRPAKVGTAILVGIILLVLIGSLVVPYKPTSTVAPENSPPSLAHPFGTDYAGHDILSQVIWGAFPSLGISLYAAFVGTIIGFFGGIVAGYYGKMEIVIGGLADIVMSFPSIPFLILLGSIFLGNQQILGTLLVIIMWAPICRSVRYQAKAVKKLAFVDSAKTSGMNSRQMILRILAPEVAPVGIASFIIALALGIVYLTAVEFLGIGNPQLINWGNILYWAQQYAFNARDWWWVLAPGLIITLVSTAFALIGFGFEEIANPRLRKY